MDNYTKQCDCPEIQDGWVPKVRDSIFIDGKVKIYLTKYATFSDEGNGTLLGYKEPIANCIFLPSIAQLMDMVEEKGKFSVFNMLHGFHVWYIDTPTSGKMPPRELWLAFVMHKKFGKSRDGEKWRTIK